MQSDCEHQLCQEINDKWYSISQKYCNAKSWNIQGWSLTENIEIHPQNEQSIWRAKALSFQFPCQRPLTAFIPHKGSTRVDLYLIFYFFLVTFQQASVLRITLYVSVPDPIKYPPAHPSHKQVLKRPGYLWHKSSNGRHRPWGQTLKTDTASYRATEA